MKNQTNGAAASGCIYYLDFLRFAAISMIVLLHVLTGVSDTIPEQMTASQLQIYEIIKELCTLGVPVFLMISGALFLAPEKEISLHTLFFKYIRRILLALVLFGTFYALLELVAGSRSLKPVYLWQAFYNMLTGNSWAHMWYLYALLGLYLFLPLFKTFTAHAAEKTYRYVLILLFTANSVLPFLEKSFHFHPGIEFPTTGIYLFYYLCGYYLHRRKYGQARCAQPQHPDDAVFVPHTPETLTDAPAGNREKNKITASALTLVITLVILFVNTFCSLGLDMQYDSPFIVLSSMALFYLAGRMKKGWRFCSRWRNYYFTIYLVHTFFLNLAYKIFHVTPLIGGGYLLLPVFWAGTFFLSLLSAWILLKIPPLKKYVL